MVRGIVLGSLAFAATFALERQFGDITQDIVRYDRIRAMSGDPPFWREQLSGAVKKATAYVKSSGQFRGLLTGLQGDLMRYLRMRSM